MISHILFFYKVAWIKKSDAKDKIIELSRLPPLSPIDFTSFLFDNVERSNLAVKSIKRQIEMLSSEENPRVLENTFDSLESNDFENSEACDYGGNRAFNPFNIY